MASVERRLFAGAHRRVAPARDSHCVPFVKSVSDGEGTLLDSSMIVYGSGLSNGNLHTHEDLPVLLAGRAGNTLKPGRHMVYPEKTPLNNLFLSMLDRMDIPTETLGDSTGKLKHLSISGTAPSRCATGLPQSGGGLC